MTDPQIRYRQLVETKRHNLATERLTGKQIQVSSDTSKYVAGVQAAASRYSADKHYQGTVYASDQSAATSRYATDVGYQSSIQRTALEHADRLQRLAFDRETQTFLNAMKQKEVDLSTMRTLADNEVSRAQARKLIQDIENSIQQLALNARQIGLNETAAKFDNAYTAVRTVESGTKSLNNLADVVKKVLDLVAS